MSRNRVRTLEEALAMEARLAISHELEQTPGFGRLPGKTKDQREISRRHVTSSLLRPLDEAHAIIAEIFAKAGIFKLCWVIESIKIKVIPVYARNYVNFNQRIGRTLDRTAVAERTQQRAHQRGFSGTQLAVEPDDCARRQRGRELAPERDGRRFVRQRQRER